jgi:O-antigen/teichoic acid export membrane protein
MACSHRMKLSLRVFKWSRRKAVLIKRYKDFPIYNASSGMLMGITLAVPIFFLTAFFPAAIVGFYALVIRVGNAPLAFISASVSQVNLKKVVDLVSAGESVKPYLIRVTAGLTAIAVLPTLIFVVYAEDLFALVFGERWREAGLYLQILAPALAVRFVVAAVSTTLDGTNNNRLAMIWRVTAFTVTIAVFSWFAPGGDVARLLQAVLVADIAIYLFYYGLIWRAAGRPRNR